MLSLVAEEARWRSELREREAQRMAVLEAEWRRRERAREAEIAALKAEYLVLEERAQQVGYCSVTGAARRELKHSTPGKHAVWYRTPHSWSAVACTRRWSALPWDPATIEQWV